MIPTALKRYGGIAAKIYAAANLLYKEFVKNEQDANKIYRSVYPTLATMHGKYGRTSKEFSQLLNVLAALAPLGAKRSNFKRKYIENQDGWRQLPKDPDNIPFGYWW